MTAQILHPSSFIETESCAGPRYVREQPSRETPGVLLADKYIVEYQDNSPIGEVEFNLPFRNAIRSVKQLDLSLSKLTPEQTTEINRMLYDITGGALAHMDKKITIVENKEKFGEFTSGQGSESETLSPLQKKEVNNFIMALLLDDKDAKIKELKRIDNILLICLMTTLFILIGVGIGKIQI
jgi:hypothetical protein